MHSSSSRGERSLARRGVTTLLLGAALVLGCQDQRPPAAPDSDAPEIAPSFPKTRVEPVTVSRAKRLGYVGVISARQSLDVSAKLDGQLSAVNVRLGDKVTKGEVLAVVDDRPLRNALNLARAKKRSAQAAIALARVDVGQTKARLDLETRAFNAGTTSRKLMLDARYAHQRAVARRSQAQADAVQYTASVGQLTRQLDDAKIRAPFAGTVSLRHLDPGATVTRGARVVRLISAGNLWVRFAVPSEDAALLRHDRAVNVSIEALGVVVPATIRQVAPELDPTTQMIITEAQLAIPQQLEGRVQAGFVARVKLAGHDAPAGSIDAGASARRAGASQR